MRRKVEMFLLRLFSSTTASGHTASIKRSFEDGATVLHQVEQRIENPRRKRNRCPIAPPDLAFDRVHLELVKLINLRRRRFHAGFQNISEQFNCIGKTFRTRRAKLMRETENTKQETIKPEKRIGGSVKEPSAAKQKSKNNAKLTKMKTLKYTPKITAAATLLTCLIFATAAVMASDPNPKPEDPRFLLISFEENFTFFDGTNAVLDGKATLAGAFSDRGTRHQEGKVTSVSRDGRRQVITGTSTIVGAKGTLLTEFTATIFFDDSDTQYIEGVESITGGTGIYAGARGKGTFENTQDGRGAPYQIVGVVEVNVKGK